MLRCHLQLLPSKSMFFVRFRYCSDESNISCLLFHRRTINGSFMTYSGCGILLVLGIVLVRVAHPSLSTIRHAPSSVRYPRVCIVSLFVLALQTKADVPRRTIPAKASTTSRVFPPPDVRSQRYMFACLFDLSLSILTPLLFLVGSSPSTLPTCPFMPLYIKMKDPDSLHLP